MSKSPTRRRRLVPALAALSALLALLAIAAPAGAAASCGRQVIDDWYDDGRVDGTYALHCYDDAIEALPRDVRDYSSAKEDIERALQARLRGQPAPAASGDPSPPAEPEDPDTPVAGEDPEDPATTVGPEDPDTGAEAASAADGESASSVPLPLLVLAGLALLLIAGGSAGYLFRRYRGRDVPPPAV